MEKNCTDNLNEIKNLLVQLTNENYTQILKHLSGATIGQHVRHIIEFYQTIVDIDTRNSINYDIRRRNLRIEEDINYAIQLIEDISNFFCVSIPDRNCKLESNLSSNNNECLTIPTSLYRELAYCLEHSIHHQALIKVGLIELDKVDCINSNFGIAPATIRHKKSCVQ